MRSTQPYILPVAWEDAISSYADWLTVGGASAATVRLRRQHVRMVAKRTGARCPDAVTTLQLVALAARYDWSVEHRRSVRAALDGFYRWASQFGICQDNPAAGLPRVAQQSPAPRPATDDIWRNLLIGAGTRERLMARLAGEAGLRRAEVARAHRDDLIADLCGWSLIVARKGGKQRVVPITDSLAAAIVEHTSSGWLFPGRDGGHLSAGHVGTVISRLMPPGWSMHKLRHRFATRGFAGTGNLRAVQEALGHASVATTQRYVAVSAAQVRAVSEAAAAA